MKSDPSADLQNQLRKVTVTAVKDRGAVYPSELVADFVRGIKRK
jgi:hypothetical protein